MIFANDTGIMYVKYKVDENIQYILIIPFIKEFRRMKMINFDEELAKYQPSLEVDQAEETIYKNDLTDVTDIIKDIMNEIKNK